MLKQSRERCLESESHSYKEAHCATKTTFLLLCVYIENMY